MILKLPIFNKTYKTLQKLNHWQIAFVGWIRPQRDNFTPRAALFLPPPLLTPFSNKEKNKGLKSIILSSLVVSCPWIDTDN